MIGRGGCGVTMGDGRGRWLVGLAMRPGRCICEMKSVCVCVMGGQFELWPDNVLVWGFEILRKCVSKSFVPLCS